MDSLSKLTKTAVIAFLFLGMLGCSNDDDGKNSGVENRTIADFISSKDDYSSLALALDITGLKTILNGGDNYTLFAPNNVAFDAYLSDRDYSSLEEIPVEDLKQLLLNHLQKGKMRSKDLKTNYIESMAQGSSSSKNLSLYINVGDKIRINGVAEVTNADIELKNGIIHEIDYVIEPPNITTFLNADPTFQLLISAFTRESSYTYLELLQGSGELSPFTLFAPTNNAFEALRTDFMGDSYNEFSSDFLSSVLSYHIISGTNLRSGEFDFNMILTNDSGEIEVYADENIYLTDERERTANVIKKDIQANNGVIHSINKVLLPREVF